MEPARVLIARAAPAVLFDQGTVSPSIHGEAVSSSFFYPWTSFVADIMQALSTLDLSGQVSLSDSAEGEKYMVGNELGLTGRFAKNVCDPVTKALSVTRLRNLFFGDIQCVRLNPTLIPDVVLLSTENPGLPRRDNTAAIATGEIKTFWTFDLENYRLSAGSEDLTALELPIGQLVGYMRMLKLRFGFLTTYKTTVFVRRMSDFRFEISDPINYLASAPSLRECFVGLSVIASESPQFAEEPDFRVELLRISRGLQASTRPSPHRHHIVSNDTPPDFSKYTFTPRSILFGEAGIATAAATYTRKISQTHGKAVFAVEFGGRTAVAKWWSTDLFERFDNEKTFYNTILDQQPQGYPFFPSLLAFGEIITSSIIPSGYILILSEVAGEKLSHISHNLNHLEWNLIRDQCRRAIVVLRRLGIYLQDCGPHNVLFSRSTGRVTMIDFEYYAACRDGIPGSLETPELRSILGRERSITGTGG